MPMRRIILTTTTLFALMLTTGCSPIIPKYKVTIDAITAPNVAMIPSSYDIKALDPKKDALGLKFQQQVAELSSMLNRKGYQPTTSAPAQSIYFDYGLIKVNESTESYTQPDLSFHVGWGYPYYGGFYGQHFNPFWNDFYGGGYTTYHKTHIYYNRYVTLLAKDASSKELWRVDVSSIGESKNLKKIIPLLIKATEPYIGTTTKEPIQLVIKDESIKKK
jgi:hypothetical protein